MGLGFLSDFGDDLRSSSKITGSLSGLVSSIPEANFARAMDGKTVEGLDERSRQIKKISKLDRIAQMTRYRDNMNSMDYNMKKSDLNERLAKMAVSI